MIVPTDLENELRVASGERPGGVIIREIGIDVYTLLYLKWMTNKILSYCIAQGTLLCIVW